MSSAKAVELAKLAFGDDGAWGNYAKLLDIELRAAFDSGVQRKAIDATPLPEWNE